MAVDEDSWYAHNKSEVDAPPLKDLLKIHIASQNNAKLHQPPNDPTSYRAGLFLVLY